MSRGFDEFFGTLANTPFYHPKQFVDSRLSPDVRNRRSEVLHDRRLRRTSGRLVGEASQRPVVPVSAFQCPGAPLQPPQKHLDQFANIKDEKRRSFAAMMSAMDEAVGRVLAKIRDMGQEEDTLIIFLSDNGGPTQQTSSHNGVLRGFKATTLEGGVRVPFCMQCKGRLPAGKVYEHPIIQLDMLPTCVDAGGKIDPAWKLDGVDLLPCLTGVNKERPHETLYWRSARSGRSARATTSSSSRASTVPKRGSSTSRPTSARRRT